MRPAAASKAAVPEARAPAPESRQRRLRGYALIVCAAVLWASQGVFYKQLIEVYDLPPATIVFFRTALTSALLFAYVLTASWRRRQPVGVPWRDLAGFALYGLVGVAAFFMLYIHAVDAAGVSVAAVLMYTAPAWVVGISVLFLGERLTRRKAAALALAVGGAALVSGVYQVESLRLNAAGVLFGLGAGLGYGLYTVFNKVALRRHPPWTVLAYALGFGTLFLLPFQSGAALGRALADPGALLWLLGVTILTTLLGNLTFVTGLRDVPASNASIVSTVEPVGAMAFGWLLFSERLDWPQALGGALIIGAVIVLARRSAPAAEADAAD